MKIRRLLTASILGLGLILALGLLMSTSQAAPLTIATTSTLNLAGQGSISLTVLFRDDFSGTIDGSWTIQNDDSSYYTVTADHLELRANAGDIWESQNDHRNLFLIDTPSAFDFDLTIRVIEFSPVHQHAAQIDLIAYDDDDNLVRHIYGYPYGAHNLEFGAEVGGVWSDTGNTDPAAVTPMDFGNDPFYLRLRKAGDVYRQYYSTDGVVFTATRKIVAYGDGTPAKVGFVALADPSESSVAKIDWFEVTQLLLPGNPVIHPISNAHTAPITTTVFIAYDQAIDPTTVSTHTFAIHAMQTGLLLEAYSVDSGTITLSPTYPFKPGELVQASATADTLNMSGQGPILPTVWQFRVASTDGSGFFIGSGQSLGNSISFDAALGDLDEDGDLDALVANFSQPNKVWLNNGDGTLTDSGQNLGSTEHTTRVALGDLDGDGDLDAFETVNTVESVSSSSTGNRVWLNNGSGVFTDSGQSLGTSGSEDVALGDLDGDGDLDAFIPNTTWPGPGGEPNKVWLNDGNGFFSDSGQNLGHSTSWAAELGDLDGDGDLDVFIANNSFAPANRVWLNDGSGTFYDSGQSLGGLNSEDVALGDLDGDGDLDAFVVNSWEPQPNKVWLNDGNGFFSDSGQNLGSSISTAVELGDLDGDGDLDAFVANLDGPSDNFNGKPNKVWLNDRNGVFSDSGQDLGNAISFGLGLGDLDGDGDLDALVTNLAGEPPNHQGRPNIVWLNQSQTNLYLPLVLRNQ